MNKIQSLPLLPASILARRSWLPDKPTPVKLMGEYVYLEPLIASRDAKTLFVMSNGNPITLGERSMNAYSADELIWRYMFDGPFQNEIDFEVSLIPYINAPNGLAFCVFDRSSRRQVGITNFMNNSPAHLKIELGGIWYSPIVQRTQANTEATYLMLKAVFDLGYRRVEWKCDSRNQRSRYAALRMGFKFEGIQESHMIMKNCNRDTAWFRMLESEWPEAKMKLEALLYQ
jgi:RimJ/RimL family protein N-acetyltransferase